ncbi:hypothetical protein ACFIJ5_07575 [Haloimpatiens sp. FM7330]|uniref:hypothetical protein n=1 Tax=Haloimpatiens sp. FM7330 TaxID=3298610 RepID=UPI00362D2CAF
MKNKIFFEQYDGRIIGFDSVNVDKLYNCFGLYRKNEEGELERIEDGCDSDYYTEDEIIDGQVLNEDGTKTELNRFEKQHIIYRATAGSNVFLFEYGQVSDVRTDLKKECENVWIDNNGQSYIDISKSLNYTIILKKENEMTDEEWKKIIKI